MDGRRNPRPINITQSLHVSPTVPNYIKLTWTHDYTSFTYNVVGIYLMRRRSPKQLCDLLHSTSLQNANVMRMEIIKKLSPSGNFTSGSAVHNQSHSAAHTDDDDDLVMPNTLPVQLLCPLSKCRIEVPVRGRNCRHVQCYDATTYLIINERKPTWNCPVCDGKATYGDLIIDGLFLEILSSKRSQDLDEIIFHADGSWSAIGEDMAHKKSENNTNSNITESPPCRDYNQRYGLLESPYTSHITPNSIISATDSVGSSSFRHSFNTLSPTNSVNSSSNQHTSCVSQLSESPALTVRSSRVAPMIRNEISNITGSNTPAYHMSVSKQTSQDKEQNQQTGQEPSSLTIDLTLSDDENEQQNKSVQNIISNSRIPITDTNSSARLVNAVAPLPSSLSPQFPPSEFSQSTLCSENTPQFPLSSSMTSKQSSTSLSNVSYVERCNQTSTVPTVHPLESNLIQSTYVSRSIETPNYPGTVTSSNPKHFPSAGDRDLTKRSYNDSIHSSTQIDVPVSLSSVSLVGSKRGISSEQDFPLLNSHEVANQPLTSIETRSGLTIHSVSSLSNESRHCTLAPVKIPRNEITHNEFPGSFTTCYQGPCSNNATINNNSNNNAKRSTSSPAFSDSYKHHNNASRQQQVQGYHNRPSTSFYADQSSNRSYHNENSSNGNTRYSYHNPNESNSINRAYGCYPSSRNVHYPTTDSTAINPHGRQTSCNVRNPYSCYEPHYRNSPSNPSIRDVLQYNSHQMKSSELSNSKISLKETSKFSDTDMQLDKRIYLLVVFRLYAEDQTKQEDISP
ncbi:unnamed protein product [Heterobilharzia americana]|nr:unnamed protein product [Heterobilharzia americana]